MITNRLTSLRNLSNRIKNDKRLSDSERNNLTSNISTATAGLSSLKSKIGTASNVTTAKPAEKQIITNYYVYATLEPKIRLLITINNLQTVTLNMQALVPQIQNLINTYKSQGKDVSQLQTLLSDISSQLQTISTTLATDKTTMNNVSTTTKDSSTIFAKVRQDLSQIVTTDFPKIRSDFAQMRPLFKQLINPGHEGTASHSASQIITVTTAPASPSAGL
jgi:DNA repair exonuclease SbcCD ATPase subunit